MRAVVVKGETVRFADAGAVCLKHYSVMFSRRLMSTL
jgi:hypothetical protein